MRRTASRIQPGDGDPRHGTTNGYGNQGCRCDDCCAANTASMDVYSKAKRAEALARDPRLISCPDAEARAGCAVEVLDRFAAGGRLTRVEVTRARFFIGDEIDAAIRARDAAMAEAEAAQRAERARPADTVTPIELAELTGVSRQAVHQWADRGKLTRIYHRGDVYFALAEVEPLLAARAGAR